MIQIEKVENGFVIRNDGKTFVFENEIEAMINIAYLLTGIGSYWEEYKQKYGLFIVEQKDSDAINQFLLDLKFDHKIEGMPFWAEIQRFKDTGKYYDSFVLNFVTDSYQDAVDIIREHHGHSSTNQSNFDYYLSNKGNLKNLHPKLITGKLAEYES